VERISFAEWQKLDLRVGKIIEAEPVEGADKLLKLTVRIGTEQKILVAGIAEHYAPDEVLGKKIVVLTNLEPKAVRGVQSEGMLLAAVTEGEETVSLVTVDEDVPEGTKVF
jgi:methionyl-tRNA synthetase